MTREEILTLHTLPEAEQVEWLKKNVPLNSKERYIAKYDPEFLLPELAFRLRDECSESEWFDAMHKVQHEASKRTVVNTLELAIWALDSEPIHWIQAALLSKQERKEK